MNLTRLAGSQGLSAERVDTIDEPVVVVAHCVAGQETSIAQRAEFLLLVARLDYVRVHQVPVVHGLTQGVLVVAQDFLYSNINDNF